MKTRIDWYDPHTMRHEKKVHSRTMPLTSWMVVPVMLSLSQNQWMFRKGEESS